MVFQWFKSRDKYTLFRLILNINILIFTSYISLIWVIFRNTHYTKDPYNPQNKIL